MATAALGPDRPEFVTRARAAERRHRARSGNPAAPPVPERHTLVDDGQERTSDYQFVIRCWTPTELQSVRDERRIW